MHCFRSWESLDASVRERITWKARDQALVKSYLVRVNGVNENPPPGEATGGDSPRAQTLHVDLSALTATRQALRARMCSTRPDRAVDLPKR
jgi:hypothetical protein